jgi:hypothetical protein
MSTRTAEREEFLADVITAAVEGGTGYWAQVSQYQYVMDGDIKVYCGEKVEGGGTRATLHEMNDDETGYKSDELVVTTDTIAAGIAKLADRQVQLNVRILDHILEANRENDATNIDADDADIIVQVALLGEIIYG